jgi:molybdopterin-guanine dinucleotide biosynthesis protein A
MLEALCAYYAPEALPVCSRLLAEGERRAQALYAALPSAMMIPERVLREHGDPERLFLSVDSQEQLETLAGVLPRLSHAPRR